MAGRRKNKTNNSRSLTKKNALNQAKRNRNKQSKNKSKNISKKDLTEAFKEAGRDEALKILAENNITPNNDQSPFSDKKTRETLKKDYNIETEIIPSSKESENLPQAKITIRRIKNKP